jgi:CRISPR/Cas system-associated endoribonuclease Cas2
MMIRDEKECILLRLAKDEYNEKRNEKVCELLKSGETLTQDLNFKIKTVESEIRKLHRELEDLLKDREQKLIDSKLSRRNFGESDGQPINGYPLHPDIIAINAEYNEKVRDILSE